MDLNCCLNDTTSTSPDGHSPLIHFRDALENIRPLEIEKIGALLHRAAHVLIRTCAKRNLPDPSTRRRRIPSSPLGERRVASRSEREKGLSGLAINVLYFTLAKFHQTTHSTRTGRVAIHELPFVQRCGTARAQGPGTIQSARG